MNELTAYAVLPPGAEPVPMSPADRLMGLAISLSEQSGALRAVLDADCDALAAVNVGILSPRGRRDHDARVHAWTESATEVARLEEQELAIFGLLGRMEAGEATPEEIAGFLPAENDDSVDGQPGPSKKKLALAREAAFIGADPRDVVDGPFGPGNDRGRLSTGHHRTRVTLTGSATEPGAAVDAFFGSTDDTYGGQVRIKNRTGSGTRYTDAAGHRIKKR